jgi:iron-sulfur cluster assembly protein
MAMALDEPKDTDDVYKVDGFEYIVNKDFMEKAKPIKIDFREVGFKIDSGIDLQSACSSCSTTGSCC